MVTGAAEKAFRASANPVLLLMDYQEGIARNRERSGREVERRGVLEAAAKTLAAFRELSDSIVHIRVAFEDDYRGMTSSAPAFRAMRDARRLLLSDSGSDICSEVAPVPGEPVITKGCVNPFVGTNLTQILNRLAPTELVLGGVATNYVVESTARFAADSGYPVVVLEDLCASFSRELHDFAIEQILPSFATVMDSSAYLRRLEE